MIGWNCRVGYWVEKTLEPIKNMSEFIVVESPRYFTIGTNYVSDVNFSFMDPSETENVLRQYMGRDFSSIICFCNRKPYSEGQYIRLFFPNMLSQCEETLRAITDITGSHIAVHIPSLNRLLTMDGGNGGQSTNVSCYSINSDGSLSPLYAGSLWYVNQNFVYPIIKNYSSGMDLSTASFAVVGGTINTDTFRLGYISSVNDQHNNGTRLWASMFSSDSKPDFEDKIPPIPPVDPYEPADPSGPGDLPPGTFDDTSDPIPLPSLPSLSAANTGFTRIYNPTLAQVQSLARYLWTDESVITTIWNHIKQYFEDPMQAMIGFNLVPVPVPDAGSEEFALMYLGTGVYMNVAANQFVDVNCGTVELERYYGSALDQSPYTKVHCYLPYIGTVQLDTDEVMGTTLTVNYRVDIVSGSCVASILVDGNVLYQYSGHCAITIPFSSADFSSYVNAAIQVAKLGIAAGANAGMAALASANQEAQQETGRVVTRTTETRNTTRNPTTGRQITRSTQTVVSTTQYPPEESKSETKASFAGLSPANISNTVGQIMSSKPNILHSGSFSGNSGYLGVRRPYLIIERPNMCLPESFQSLNGYPSMITMALGDCVGYTRVQQVQLTGLWATNPEQAEILELLKGGVIF